MILKLVGEIRKAFSPFDWSIFLLTYLLAIAAVTLLRAVAINAAIARATVVWLRLVAQAIAGIATSELGQGVLMSPDSVGLAVLFDGVTHWAFQLIFCVIL